MNIQSTTRPIAQQGIKVYQDISSLDWGDARTATREYLDTIVLSGDTPTEQALARVTATASSKYLTDESGARANHAALQALAAGVGGPLGVAIAKVGWQAIDQASHWDDARKLGDSFLSGVQQHGTALEGMIAAATLRATSSYLCDDNACVPKLAALSALGNGLTGDPEQVLARVAANAWGPITEWDDARAIGKSFLTSIVENAQDPLKRMQAQTALNASKGCYEDEDAARIQKSAFDTLAGPKEAQTVGP